MYATPSNNYWLVGDQPPDVRWSSGAVAYVADTDATYVAWLAAGYETSEIASEQELADLLNATYPAGSPIPPLPIPPTPLTGNGPVFQQIITAVPTVMVLAEDFTFHEKSPIELLPRTEEFRAGLTKEVIELEVPGGVTPFTALSGNITVPDGIYRLVIWGQAAGGGAGGCGTTTGPGCGGPGGAGETRRIIVNVSPFDVIPYTIGAEGTGGVNANPGTTAADLVLGAGAAAYPVIADIAYTDHATDTPANPVPVSLPPGIVAGNMLLLHLNVTGSTNPTITTPAGWTLLQSAAVGSGTRNAIFWKIASGSEGASVSITMNIPATWACGAMRITGHDPATAPQMATVGEGAAGGASKKPNPPALTPSWGSKSTLWLASAYVSNNGVVLTGQPSGFETAYGPPSGIGVRVAAHNSNATVLNPTEFTVVYSAAVNWQTTTVAILPATPANIMVCKGGTNGIQTNGGTAGGSGTTPTGSGGIRIEPVCGAYNFASAAGCHSVGGATLFGQCPNRSCAAGGAAGTTGQGYGSGGGGPGHQNTTNLNGGAGAPGMILVEGYGLDA